MARAEPGWPALLREQVADQRALAPRWRSEDVTGETGCEGRPGACGKVAAVGFHDDVIADRLILRDPAWTTCGGGAGPSADTRRDAGNHSNGRSCSRPAGIQRQKSAPERSPAALPDCCPQRSCGSMARAPCDRGEPLRSPFASSRVRARCLPSPVLDQASPYELRTRSGSVSSAAWRAIYASHPRERRLAARAGRARLARSVSTGRTTASGRPAASIDRARPRNIAPWPRGRVDGRRRGSAVATTGRRPGVAEDDAPPRSRRDRGNAAASSTRPARRLDADQPCRHGPAIAPEPAPRGHQRRAGIQRGRASKRTSRRTPTGAIAARRQASTATAPRRACVSRRWSGRCSGRFARQRCKSASSSP